MSRLRSAIAAVPLGHRNHCRCFLAALIVIAPALAPILGPTLASAQSIRGGAAGLPQRGMGFNGGGFGGGGFGLGIPNVIGIPGVLSGYGSPPPGYTPTDESPDDESIEPPPRRRVGADPGEFRQHRRAINRHVVKILKTTKPKAAAQATVPPSKPAGLSEPGAPSTALAAEEPGIVPSEILVTLRPQASTGAATALARRQRLILLASQNFTLVATTVYRYRILDRRSVATVMRALAANPQVLSAQPNHVFTLTADAAPPTFSSAQYAVAKLHLDEAHRLATGRDIPVAVIDSEIDVNHPALVGAVSGTYDTLGAGTSTTAHRHGTATAGIIAAREPLASVAPAARLLAIRAFADEATGLPSGAEGTTIHILRALDWAAGQDARIVNMSFAGPQDALLARFLAAGAARGAIYVAAAGNAGPNSPPLYPAADAHVLAVTATDAEDKLFPAANHGAYICVAAPGVEILVAVPGGAYGFSSGTSMAAAEVSGIIAMLLEAKPDLSPEAVRAALAGSADDRGAPGPDAEFGAGLADAQGALKAVTGEATVAGSRVQQP